MIASASTAAAILAAMVSWKALDLPRPAWTSDLVPISDRVADLAAFTKDSRLLILNGDWWRYEAQLSDVRRQIKDDPSNRYLEQLERRLRREQATIQHQIDELKK